MCTGIARLESLLYGRDSSIGGKSLDVGSSGGLLNGGGLSVNQRSKRRTFGSM